ncbi:hypothetical protein ACO0OE_000156 [Hanseniaspora uvarum]
MLDLADKTGSTSDMANVNDDTQYFNETTANTIIHTPINNQRVLSDINEKSIQEDEPASFYSNSLGKKMINVTKENHIKPPMRSKNRPISTDASSLGSELSQMLGNEGSVPSSPSKNRRLPLSPRKFDLQQEIKRQSLDDVQDKLSEQLEELKSIASGNEPTEKENFLIFEKPQVDYQGSTLESTESLDKFYSAANSIEDNINSDEFAGKFAQNISITKPLNTVVKKISVPVSTRADSMNENSLLDSYKDEDVTETNNIDDDDDEYEDIESDHQTDDSAKSLKKSIRRQLNTKTPANNFNLNTMESLLGNVAQVNDFDNLGMRDEEKKYLQLLVNNLSKLTADMILDPSKYEEGLRRLKKAALALEGF